MKPNKAKTERMMQDDRKYYRYDAVLQRSPYLV